jgi:hypothetical protein
MFRWTRFAALGLVAACAGAAALAAPAPTNTDETVKDRAAFLPLRKYQALPGKTVGVMVSDVAKVMLHDGRSGPPDAVAFSRDGQSYRWVYVPATDKVTIPRLSVPVGDKGDKKAVFEKLSMANAPTLKQWDVDKPYVLVEAEVNDGQGSPAIEGFVATKMKRLDGSKEYPLVVADVVEKCKKKYKGYVEEQQKAIDAAMGEAQKKAIKDAKATGPRETDELMYVTWLPDTGRLRVAFRTTVTDGAYKYGGGVKPRPGDPLPPKRGGPGFLFPPPPPLDPGKFRWGTQFGVEFGRAYEVDKAGDFVRTLTLPIESFQKELPAPPARIIGRDPPPPPPLTPKPDL